MRHALHILVVVSLGSDGIAVGGADKPAALAAAERARSAAVLRTGTMRAQIETFPGDNLHFEFADFRLAHEQGTMASAIYRTAKNAPGVAGTGIPFGQVNTLRKDGRLWWHPAGTMSAYVLPGDSPAGDETGDPRTIGLNPWFDNPAMYERMLRDASHETGQDLTGLEHLPGALRAIGARYEETLRTNPGGVKFDEQVQGGLHVVTAQIGDARLRWWIDPAQGWNPVRTAVWQGETLLSETTITNRQRGEDWFPEDVYSYSPQYKQGKEPFQVTTVFKATFNAPDDPPELTPRDIGLAVGMKVIVADGRTSQTLYWDGQDAVPQEVLQRRVERGEIKIDLAVLNAARQEREGPTTKPMWGGPSAPPGVTPVAEKSAPVRWRMESDWERYTRLFIERYKLDADQTQKAWSILRSAQALAEGYLARHADEISDVDKRLAESAGDSATGSKQSRAALEQRRERLLAPIDEIFEKQLKARLDKLPTRAQRRAADGEPAPREEKPAP